MKYSIRARIFSGFAFVLLLLVIIVSFIIFSSQQTLETSIGGQSVFLADSMLRTLKNNIQAELETLFLEASRDEFIETFHNQLNHQSGSITPYDDWGKNVGKPVKETGLPLAENPLSAYLENRYFRFVLNSHGIYRYQTALVTDENGAIIAVAGLLPEADQKQMDYWTVVKEKDFLVGEIIVQNYSSAGVIPISVRLNGPDGSFKGVLHIELLSSAVFRSLAIGAKKYRSTQLHILSMNGQRLYSTQTGRLMEDLSQTGLFKGIRSDSGHFITEKGKKKKLFAYAKAGGYLNLDFFHLILILENDHSEVTAPILRLTKAIIIISAVVALLVIIITALVTHTISVPIKALMEGVGVVGQGNLDHLINVGATHEIGALCDAFNEMTRLLRQNSDQISKNQERIELENWLKTGQTELNAKIQEGLPPNTLANLIVETVCKYLDALSGAVYLIENGETLTLAGGYALPSIENLIQNIPLREGLIGQAAASGESRVLSNVPDEIITINLGDTAIKPRNFLISPFEFEKERLGVIFLTSLNSFSNKELEFSSRILENIGAAFHSSQSRLRLQDLLEETQRQSEELQSQQEELRVSNEELEEQTSFLRESKEQLQSNQEELRRYNETLRNNQEELKQTNAELEEKSEALEIKQREVEEQNKELQTFQGELQDKAKDLELSNKYKSEFLANMSHELRTPLNSLLIYAQLLYENKEKNLKENQVKFAKSIHMSGTELLDLINDILDLSKIEAGRVEPVFESVLTDEIREYTHFSFNDIVQQKGLVFDIEMANDLPPKIQTDRQRLFQILKNLLSNALKFTETGGIQIRVYRADSSKQPPNKPKREYISIAVKDSGIGIPADKQKLVFEAFQQVDGSTSRQYGGTGLGLSISRELAALLCGWIDVSSEDQKGSEFILTIPVEAESETVVTENDVQVSPTEDLLQAPPKPEVKLESKPVEAIEKDPAESGKMEPAGPPEATIEMVIEDDRGTISEADKSLLIIDDDVAFAKILLNLAHEKGFKCVVATNGKDGLALAEKFLPSAIILDINMPKMDGWAVMDKLKKNPVTQPIPVHFISISSKKMAGLKMGAIGFLTKPVSLEKLNQAFDRISDTITKTISQVLVVEDNRQAIESLAELFKQRENLKLHFATDSKEAIEALRSKSIDLIVLDLRLPDMNGYDLLSTLEKETAGAMPPVIVHTGKELTNTEESRIKKYAESIIMKGAASSTRLLDEVTLFLHRVKKDLPAETQDTFSMVHDQESALSKKKILLVDDDMRNVYALMAVLTEKQMIVKVAANGQEALEALEEEPDIDLVLMDIMMPVMDGLEATKKIRQRKMWEKIPIIALTAKAMSEDKQQCLEAGANDYVSKPVNIDRLLSLIRVWITR